MCLAEDRPDPEKTPRVIDVGTTWTLQDNRCEVSLDAPSRGWLWLSIAPIEGWRWTLDGRRIELEQGPGIVQYVEIPAGRHRLEGLYRPPALLPSALVSLVTAGLVVGLFSAAFLRSKFAPVAATPEGTPRPGSDGTSGKTDATPTVGSTPLSAAGPRRLG